MKNSLTKNAVYKVILNLFNLLVPLFVGPYIAGLLDKELYGIYNRVVAEFNIILILGGFGIYNYGVREISKVRDDPQAVNRLFSTLFLMGIISNGVVGIVYVIYFLFRSSGIDLIIYCIMMVQLVGNIFYIEFINEAAENYGFITKKTILIRLCYLISIFTFVKKKEDIIPYTIIVCLTVALNNIVSYIYCKRKLHFDFSEVNKLKYQIIPLFVTFLLTNVEVLYNQLDKLMLSPVINDVAVTEYTLPTTLMGMIATLPLALVSVAIPRLARYIGKNDHISYLDTLKSTTNAFMLFIIPMSFGVFVLSKEIMWLYTRDVYTYAYPVLMIAALSRLVFSYQSIIMNLVMYVNSMEKELTIFMAIFGIVNAILNGLLVLFHQFSPATALMTTTFSILLFNIVSSRYFRKKLNIKFGYFSSKRIVGYLLISFLFYPISLVVKLFHFGYMLNIIILVPLCITIYGVYLLLTKDPILSTVYDKISKKRRN